MIFVRYASFSRVKIFNVLIQNKSLQISLLLFQTNSSNTNLKYHKNNNYEVKGPVHSRELKIPYLTRLKTNITEICKIHYTPHVKTYKAGKVHNLKLFSFRIITRKKLRSIKKKFHSAHNHLKDHLNPRFSPVFQIIR
jgi:hypothetical protein